MTENRSTPLFPFLIETMTSAFPKGIEDVLTRVERNYRNEIAEKRQAVPAYTEREIARVDKWLAGVSFEEWFALQAQRNRLAQALRLIRDTSSGYTANVAESALSEAQVPDPEEDFDHV